MRVFKWIFMQVLMLCVLSGWIFYGHEWAENITKFMIWLAFIAHAFSAFSDEVKTKARKKGRSVNKNISYLFDFAFLLALVGWGSVFYGVLFLVSNLFEAAIFDQTKTENNMNDIKPPVNKPE